MAVMDLVPPPVAMMAISGTWEHTEADCWGHAGREKTQTDPRKLRKNGRGGRTGYRQQSTRH